MEIIARASMAFGKLKMEIEVDGVRVGSHTLDDPVAALSFIRGLSSFDCLARYEPPSPCPSACVESAT